jgi:uncharacterized protein HemX
MSMALRIVVVALGVALIGFGVQHAYRTYERDQSNSRIRGAQSNLQVRINALKAEMQTPTSDPAEIKSRQDQLNALQKQLDAIKKETYAPDP